MGSYRPWVGKNIKFAVGSEQELERLKAQNGNEIVEVKTYLELETGRLLIVPVGWDEDDIRYNYNIRLDNE